jgi:hypothetical protein
MSRRRPCRYSIPRPVDEANSTFGFIRKLRRQRVHNLQRLNTHPNNLTHEPNDVFFIIRVVGVTDDAAAFIRADLVLVDDPVECAAIAEAVLENLGRNFRKRQRFVDLEMRLVIGERNVFGFDPLER